MVDSSLRTIDTPLDECSSNECKLPRKHEGLCDVFTPSYIIYTNWHGEKRKRKLSPTGQMFYRSNEWHKIPCWLFEAIDCDDGKQKHFALAGVQADNRVQLRVAIELRWNSV